MRPLALSLVLAGSLVACDSTVPTGETETDPPVVLPTVPTFEDRAGLTDRVFAAALTPDLSVGSGGYSEFVEAGSVLFGSGLWLAGQQEGAARVAIERYGTSSFGPCADVRNVVYAVDADTSYSAEGWPAEVGAPTDTDGAPRAYGDRMGWVSTCTQDSNQLAGRTLAGIRVNAALFGYDSWSHVIFVRYEIRNESGSPVSDAYAGFWADPDLTSDEFGPLDNLIGFDRDAGIGFVYPAQRRGSAVGGTIPAAARGTVAGVAVLESPGDAPLAAYRIMNKHGGPYGEGGVETPDGAAFALRGLSNEGDPMIDPTTGEPTPYAYTGDPVAMTGWLDGFDGCGSACVEGQQVGEELRQLTSVGPFSLGAGETTVFTIAYVYQKGSNLADGLARLRTDAAALRAQPSLWRYAPTN